MPNRLSRRTTTAPVPDDAVGPATVPDDAVPGEVSQVVLIGAGLLAAELAEALVRHGTVANLLITDPSPIDPSIYPRPGVASTAGGALAHFLRSRDPVPTARIRSVKHWTDLDTLQPALVIVATATLEPDRAITEHLTRRDVPHLVARLAPERVRVGPLVVPGLTPCLTCIDAVLTEADPGWPATLLGHGTAPVATSPSPLVDWGAAVTAVQARAWLANGTADSLGCTLELEWAEPITRVRRWRRHPDCGCGWWAA